MSGCRVTRLCLSGDRRATARGADPDQRARQAHHSSPSRQPGQQTARCHSWVRRDPVHGCRGDDDRSKAFKTGREFAAWIGLVPRQNSTGGKERLGSISKQGDRYLRRLLVVGAIPSSGPLACGPTSILGDRTAGLVGRPRWSRWRWPTRWHGSPGRCWPRARPIGHRHA